MKFLDQALELLVKFGSMFLLIIAPVKEVMLAVSALVILDLITGVWAAIKLKEKIKSSGFKKTVIKTILYQLSILVAFVIEKYLIDGVPIVKVVAGLIAMTEGKSFFENMHKISGIDFWSEILMKIQSATTKVIDEQAVVQEAKVKEKPKKKKSSKKKKKK